MLLRRPTSVGTLHLNSMDSTDFYDLDGNQNLGSLGAVISRDMRSDNYLPDWLEQGVESTLRDSEEDAPPAPTYISSAQAGPVSFASSRGSPIVLTPTGPSPAGSYVRQDSGKSPWTDLDKFYDDADEEEEEEEEEDEEEEEESEEESGEEEHAEGDKDVHKNESEGDASDDDEGDEETRPLHNTS